ncbi:hypothetical protein DICA3_D24102 [Diutina catenulata]
MDYSFYDGTRAKPPELDASKQEVPPGARPEPTPQANPTGNPGPNPTNSMPLEPMYPVAYPPPQGEAYNSLGQKLEQLSNTVDSMKVMLQEISQQIMVLMQYSAGSAPGSQMSYNKMLEQINHHIARLGREMEELSNPKGPEEGAQEDDQGFGFDFDFGPDGKRRRKKKKFEGTSNSHSAAPSYELNHPRGPPYDAANYGMMVPSFIPDNNYMMMGNNHPQRFAYDQQPPPPAVPEYPHPHPHSHPPIHFRHPSQPPLPVHKPKKERKSVDYSDIPKYKLERSLKTIAEIWREYEYGLKDKPPLKTLELRYGTKWRNETESRTFLRRKKIYEAIEVGKSKGISEEDLINELEEYRSYEMNGTVKRHPLSWLVNKMPKKYLVSPNDN